MVQFVKIPLVMNLFGTKERTLTALQANSDTEIGDRLVSLMKPDIGTFVSRPWKGLPLARDALALPPRKVRRGKCQEVVMEGVDLTRLPIPKTWPMDGGHYVTLPLVVTKNPETEEHNLGMYRGQVHGKKELGLHWQIHKHGADHASSYEDGKMPVAVCIGGPPELIFFCNFTASRQSRRVYVRWILREKATQNYKGINPRYLGSG